jgi:energy-coupling factor transporter ATP-binding protein EcfA2
LKVKNIEFFNNEIFGDLVFDFCDEEGNVYSNIILAGENGTGKSSLKNFIYEFTTFESLRGVPIRNERRRLKINLNKKETTIVKRVLADTTGLSDLMDIEIQIDYSKQGWQAYTGNIIDLENKTEININDGHISQIMEIFITIFSDIEVNFNPVPIESVRSSQLDEERKESQRSSGNLATEIAQLLVDIQISDDSQVAKLVRDNPNEIPNIENLDLKMNRFINAFEYMFPNKKYSGIYDLQKSKKIMFKEFDKEIPLEKLSSGEKQIVFRGGFLLKDQQSTKGALVLIDEPEISLHPKWQQKILQYYSKLFTDETGFQTSQIILSTHSPFIIHNLDNVNSKVIILKRNEEGEIYIPEQKKFYNWTEEEIINEAFNLEVLSNAVEQSSNTLIVTEGKTDWKHLKNALAKLRDFNKQFHNLELEFLEYEDEISMGSPELLAFCQQYSKMESGKIIICVFDRDEQKILNKILENEGDLYKHWGNNVYSIAIPIPEHRTGIGNNISIEHYYLDEDIKLETHYGHRLFIGNEFSRKFGIHSSGKYVCLKKDKCGEDSITIIDRDSVVAPIGEEDSNVALSKNDFAECIVREEPPFQNICYDSFKKIFDVIEEIITKAVLNK